MKTSLAVAAGIALGASLPFTPFHKHAVHPMEAAAIGPQVQTRGTFPIVDVGVVQDYGFDNELTRPSEQHVWLRIDMDIPVTQATAAKLNALLAKTEMDGAYNVLCADGTVDACGTAHPHALAVLKGAFGK